MNPLSHAPLYVKSIDAARRSVDVVVSSESLDSHGEIVEQSWDLTRYLKNPVVLRNHDPENVVGYAENLRVKDGKLEATIVFASTPLALETWQLFHDKALRGVSAGFRPARVVHDEVNGATIRKLCDNELFEISCVAMPSNPDAVAKFKSLGLTPASFEPGDASAWIVSEAEKALVTPEVTKARRLLDSMLGRAS